MAPPDALRNQRNRVESTTMPPASHIAHDRKHDGRALAALFSVFALLVQALIPSIAMARPDPPGALVICTASGAQVIAPHGQPAPHKSLAGMPCQDCLAAAMACVATPELAVQPVAYAADRIDHPPVVTLLTPRARAPPRPPGQGPPTA